MTDQSEIIVEFDKAIGKRLKHLLKGIWGRPWLFVFEDGVVCQMGIDRGYEGGDDEFEDDLEFRLSDYKLEDLLAAGVIDEAWIRRDEQRRIEQQLAAAELKQQRERETYEQLKKQFEPSSQEVEK